MALPTSLLWQEASIYADKLEDTGKNIGGLRCFLKMLSEPNRTLSVHNKQDSDKSRYGYSYLARCLDYSTVDGNGPGYGDSGYVNGNGHGTGTSIPDIIADSFGDGEDGLGTGNGHMMEL